SLDVAGSRDVTIGPPTTATRSLPARPASIDRAAVALAWPSIRTSMAVTPSGAMTLKNRSVPSNAYDGVTGWPSMRPSLSGTGWQPCAPDAGVTISVQNQCVGSASNAAGSTRETT